MKPIVSVILPVYNGGEYLNEAIDSILCQSYTDFELIIIEDASTDNSLEIINMVNDQRIILHNNKYNLGQARSQNVGLKIASGAYVARLDQDDIMDPLRLEKQVNYLDNNVEISAVGSQIYCIDSKGENIQNWNWPVGLEKNVFNLLTGQNPVADPASMIRKDVILELGGFNADYVPSEDYDLWLRMLSQGYKCDNMDDYLTKYRVHSSQTSTIQKTKQIEKHYSAFVDFYNRLNTKKVETEKIVNYINIFMRKKKHNQINISSTITIFFNILDSIKLKCHLEKRDLRKKLFNLFLYEIKYNMEGINIIDVLQQSLKHNVFHFDLLRPLWEIYQQN